MEAKLAISAQWMLLQYQRPGFEDLAPVAVLLLDEGDSLHIRARPDFESIADPNDAEVLALTVDQLIAEAHQSMGTIIVQRLQDTLSNALRITDPTPVQVAEIDQTLLDLYRKHVESVR